MRTRSREGSSRISMGRVNSPPPRRSGFSGPWSSVPDAVVADGDPVPHPSHPGTGGVDVAGVEREGSLGALQVGGTHAGKQHSVKLLRRESDRYSNDGAEDASFTQNLPEGLALLFQASPRLTQGNQVFADREHPGGGAYLGRGQDGGVGAGVPGEEVVDVVVGGVHSGGEGGPGHRGNGRLAGGQCGEAALLLQPLEVGQQTFLHEALGQLGIHAVETHNHHPGIVGLLPALSTALEEETQQQPQGPGEEGKARQQNGQQQHQKRGNEGKTRPRSDIGLQGQGAGDSQDQGPGDGRPQGFGFPGHCRKAAASPLGVRA